MDDLDSRLRDRLFLTRLYRHLVHARASREAEASHRLHEEVHEIVARARRLRRRSRWLRLTGKPLPRGVSR